VENSKEHGLDEIAWPGTRASQFIKMTTRGGIHRETNFFSICRFNLRCSEEEDISSCNDLGSHGRWHIPVVAAVDTPSKSYSAVSTVGMLRFGPPRPKEMSAHLARGGADEKTTWTRISPTAEVGRPGGCSWEFECYTNDALFLSTLSECRSRRLN